MTNDHTPDVWGKSVPELMSEVSKMLDEADVPTEGRMLCDPTDEIIKMPEKNKYPVTQPERRKHG